MMASEEWLHLWDAEEERAQAYAREQAAIKARHEATKRQIAETTTATVVLGREVQTGEPVAVTAEAMCSGTYLLGTQGAGKSSLLEHIAYQRMEQNDCVIVLDPHGQLIDNIIARMPQRRLNDTYLLDLSDARHYPFALNIFHCSDPADETARALTRGRVLRIFRRIWPEIEAGQYVEKMLRHVTTTLIYNADCTLDDVPEWFRNPKAIPREVVSAVEDPGTRAFWQYDLPSLSARERSIQTDPFLNRVNRLLSDDLLRRLLCNPSPPFNFGRFVRQRRSLLIKLPVDADVIGEAANLVGVALFSLIYATTFDGQPKDHRDSYTLIVDEFQNFVTSEFVRLFVGGRKYGAKLVLAHQYINQLDQPGLDMNRRGVLTARTVVSFHTTPYDAVEVAPLYAPLERTWARDNLVANVAEELEHHPVDAVKKFAMRYVEPLKQASRIVQASSPLHPELDFGWGSCSFDPANARRAWALLNDLLYDAEQSGRVDNTKRNAFLEAVRQIPRYYHDDDLDIPRFDVDLSKVTAALITDPLVEHRPISGSTVAIQLPLLPQRTALVKTGSSVYHIETLPLPKRVSDDDADDREGHLLETTRSQYCSSKQAIDKKIQARPTTSERQEAKPQPEPPVERPPKKDDGDEPPAIGRRSPKKPK